MRTPEGLASRMVRCKDCQAEGLVNRRKATKPGPRCASHWRERRRAQSNARKAAHVERNFSITEEQYQSLLAYQGGGCAICGRKPGRKRLAVDHDHHICTDHPADKGCPACVRMLACTTCNKFMGHIRDDPEVFERGAKVLRNPPAKEVFTFQHAQCRTAVGS